MAFFEACFDLRRNVPIDLGVFAIMIGCRDRMPRIGLFANPYIERHFAEERHAKFRGLDAGAAMRENIRAAAAMRARK